MPLVEVISTAATRPEVIAMAAGFVRRIDKLPLPCRSSPGFLVNRVLIPYMQEGMTAVEEGITPEIVDAAATRFGMPMGPIELADVVGWMSARRGDIIGAAIGGPAGAAAADRVAGGRQSSVARPARTTSGWMASGEAASGGDGAAELTDRLMLTWQRSVACLREGIVPMRIWSMPALSSAWLRRFVVARSVGRAGPRKLRGASSAGCNMDHALPDPGWGL
jgi:3-hydroxyacyl-CoA dehydrogenase/enoyl-CoA hydratase/3-hydroxybutyryl-CoA epimerase